MQEDDKGDWPWNIKKEGDTRDSGRINRLKFEMQSKNCWVWTRKAVIVEWSVWICGYARVAIIDNSPGAGPENDKIGSGKKVKIWGTRIWKGVSMGILTYKTCDRSRVQEKDSDTIANIFSNWGVVTGFKEWSKWL